MKAKTLKAAKNTDNVKAVCETLTTRVAKTGHEMLVAALALAPVPDFTSRSVWYSSVNAVAVFTAHASGKKPEDCDMGWDAQKWLHRGIAERLGLAVTRTDGSLIVPQLVPMNAVGSNGKPKMRMVAFKQGDAAAEVLAEYRERIAVHNAR